MRHGIFWLLVWGCVASNGWARENAEKRHYFTKVLRSYLVTIDRALTQAQRGTIEPSMHQALQEGYEALKPKLPPRRSEELAAQLKGLETARGEEDLQLLRIYRELVFDAFRVVTAPTQTPEIELGRSAYKEHCAACHGPSGRGDGKLAQNKRFPMVPAPPDLDRLAAEGQRTAFSYYNLFLVGIEGTLKQAYDVSMTDDQRWSLAFYLMARPFESAEGTPWEPELLWSRLAPEDRRKLQETWGTLEQLADQDDRQVQAQMAKIFPKRSEQELRSLGASLRRTMPYFPQTPRMKR